MRRALIDRQILLDLTDEEFAERLGVSRQLWQKIRNGEVSVSLVTARRAAQVFPDLRPLAVDLLLGEPEAEVVAGG